MKDQKKQKDAEMLLNELLVSVEKGEPTQLVGQLLKELSSNIKLDIFPTLAGSVLNGASGTHVQKATAYQLIDRVLKEPQVMWKRHFFVQIRSLPHLEKQILLQWFAEMTSLQTVYISEIEKANDFLKQMVSRSFDSLNASDTLKEEFLGKINHIENRHYFHRKRRALQNEDPRNVNGTNGPSQRNPVHLKSQVPAPTD